MGPLRPESVAAVQAYYRCGDLTTGFTRYLCPDCGHERLRAFTCKTRHICHSCHQRRTRQTAELISTHVCHPVPHRRKRKNHPPKKRYRHHPKPSHSTSRRRPPTPRPSSPSDSTSSSPLGEPILSGAPAAVAP